MLCNSNPEVTTIDDFTSDDTSSDDALNDVQIANLNNNIIRKKTEYLFIEVVSGGRKLLVGSVYRPHHRINTSDFLKVLESLTVKYEDIIICGDFNSNILVESHLTDDMKSIGLHPINTLTPTHYTSTTNTLLDIFFVSNKQKVMLYDQLTTPCFSKHDLIFCAFDFSLYHVSDPITFYDFNLINHNILYSELVQVDWNSIYYMPSVNDQLNFIEDSLSHVFRKSVPLKVFRQSAKKKPWFNDEIKAAIAHRDFVYRRWKLFKITVFHSEYCTARREVNRMIKSAKSTYYSNRFTSAVGSNKTWKTIREIGIGKPSSGNSTVIDVDNVNESFINTPNVPADVSFYEQNQLSSQQNEIFFFHCVSEIEVQMSCQYIKSNAVGFDDINPKFLKTIIPQMLPYITYIFNNIITKSDYPRNWKHAKIIPTPKSNNEYRPIAILPYLSKVFERLLHQQINKYINDNNLLTNRQSGFRAKHSCTTALIDVSEGIRESIDVGDISFLILLDHSKAFDTVDHQVLCWKLDKMFSFSPSSIRLVASYLSGRSQSVIANNITSKSLPVLRGVPQGSILGPLLFSIYINDLDKQLLHCNVHLYADDVQLYISSPLININDCVEKINIDLKRVNAWANANGLCINPMKSKCLIITKKTLKLSLEPMILLNNKRIEIVQKAKNLGIIFNNTLTWSDHVTAAAGKTYSMLRTLWNTQHITPFNIRMLLAKTYIMPILLYGCELFASCDSTSQGKLEKTYNAVLRYVFNLRKYDHISHFKNKLYGVSLSNLLKIKTLILLHKIIFKHEPVYLFDRISFTRSRRSYDIIHTRYRSQVSERHFYINSIRLWNSLLPTNKSISNALLFEKELYKFFITN